MGEVGERGGPVGGEGVLLLVVILFEGVGGGMVWGGELGAVEVLLGVEALVVELELLLVVLVGLELLLLSGVAIGRQALCGGVFAGAGDRGGGGLEGLLEQRGLALHLLLDGGQELVLGGGRLLLGLRLADQEPLDPLEVGLHDLDLLLLSLQLVLERLVVRGREFLVYLVSQGLPQAAVLLIDREHGLVADPGPTLVLHSRRTRGPVYLLPRIARRGRGRMRPGPQPADDGISRVGVREGGRGKGRRSAERGEDLVGERGHGEAGVGADARAMFLELGVDPRQRDLGGLAGRGVVEQRGQPLDGRVCPRRGRGAEHVPADLGLLRAAGIRRAQCGAGDTLGRLAGRPGGTAVQDLRARAGLELTGLFTIDGPIDACRIR